MALQGKRIFIFEDHVENRVITQLALEQCGVKVAFDRWGDGTLEKLRAFAPIDMILMDLMFPNNVSGYDIYDRIRENHSFDGIPVVIVSAADADTEIPKAKEKGFAGYLTKPIDYRGFPAQISQLLQGEHLWVGYE